MAQLLGRSTTWPLGVSTAWRRGGAETWQPYNKDLVAKFVNSNFDWALKRDGEASQADPGHATLREAAHWQDTAAGAPREAQEEDMARTSPRGGMN